MGEDARLNEEEKLPKHVGCVLDGNRRFSRRLMLKPYMGHKLGAKKVKEFLRWCREIGIREVTFFTFSVENFDRPKKEFDYLMNLFAREFKNIINDKELYENKIKIRFIGRVWMFPKEVQEAMKELEEKTKRHDRYFVNFAMAYGGRSEIVDAAKKIVADVKNFKIDIDEINEDTIKEYLYMKSEPDMIIRTSGEVRTSGFLLYQSSYSEWFFVDKHWPEFEKEDFLKCIEEFKYRERRFGK